MGGLLTRRRVHVGGGDDAGPTASLGTHDLGPGQAQVGPQVPGKASLRCRPACVN